MSSQGERRLHIGVLWKKIMSVYDDTIDACCCEKKSLIVLILFVAVDKIKGNTQVHYWDISTHYDVTVFKC